MRHYLKISRNPNDSRRGQGYGPKQIGLGSNLSQGEIFSVELLTQRNARDDSNRHALLNFTFIAQGEDWGEIQITQNSEVKSFRVSLC